MLYDYLISKGIEVLWDDRDERAGVKFNDADLIGIPYRVVISKKTIANDEIEVKKRKENSPYRVSEIDSLIESIKKEIAEV
jgi:prolyl-tRNA synthetase